VGLVGYLSDWELIDLCGLNDKHIASAPQDDAYVLSKKPDLIVLISLEESRFESRDELEGRLFDSSKAMGYDVMQTLKFAEGYFLWVLGRPGTPFADSMSVL
jgi:hypothetical protein